MAPALGEPGGAGATAAPGRIAAFPGEGFAAAAADVLAGLLREAGASGPASLGLVGGSTPGPVYRELAGAPDVPWPRFEMFFGDERRVPPDDPRSNYRMARESLLDHLPFPSGRVHRLRGEAADPEAEARRYDRRLPERLDLLLLGIGEDGHTASLFPRHPALRESRRRVLAVEAPAEPSGRYTLTPPALAAARRLVVLASGAAKAVAVARAREGAWSPLACPAQLARRGLWLLDHAAAERLGTAGGSAPEAGGCGARAGPP